jgi:16S rRNA (cytidine1402-2'-O)-methyltransferase
MTMDQFTPPPAKPVSAGLYIVATPIGNLRDITLRALDVLVAADVVLAEDTRVAAKLLSAYGIKKPLLRYDDHAGPKVLPEILERLLRGEVVAQISDAGTPLISDPGYRLVSEAQAHQISVHPIPGASSVLAALCISGLPTDRFIFGGFVPNKSAARQSFFAEFSHLAATLVFFETGPRVHDSLSDMVAVFGDRKACVCRELTKLYETAHRGSLSTLRDDPALAEPRGEIVVVIAPPEAEISQDADVETALLAAMEQFGPSEAAKQIAKIYGLSKSEVYQKALALRGRP